MGKIESQYGMCTHVSQEQWDSVGEGDHVHIRYRDWYLLVPVVKTASGKVVKKYKNAIEIEKNGGEILSLKRQDIEWINVPGWSAPWEREELEV